MVSKHFQNPERTAMKWTNDQKIKQNKIFNERDRYIEKVKNLKPKNNKVV